MTDTGIGPGGTGVAVEPGTTSPTSAANPPLRPGLPWATELIGSPIQGITDDQVASALQMASEVLWARSGRQFGLSQVQVRPCRKWGNYDWMQWPWLQAYLAGDAQWSLWPRMWWGLQVSCGVHGGDECSCDRQDRIDLVSTPVVSVDEVIQDGEILDSSIYRVDQWRWLVRLDGQDWPLCQNFTDDLTEANTWAVTFTYGVAPPLSGQYAAAELARQIALAMVASNACQLPARVQNVSRQGVQVSFIELSEYLANGLTGLPLVDQFITTFNPWRLQSRARIYRPDAPPRHRVAGT